MINFKEHLKLTSVYTFFAAFPALLQLIVYPIIEGENRLGAVDFGYLAITEAIVSIIFIVCTFGMGTGIARFYYEYKDSSDNYNKLVSTVISGILGRGLLLMGVVILLAPFLGQLFSQPALQNFNEFGPSLVIAGLNRSVLATLLALYRNEKRMKIFILVSFFSAIMRSGFQLTGVLFYDLSFLGYVHGTAVGGSFITIGIIIYSYYKCGFHYDKIILRSLFPFARPLFFSDLILWGLLFADRFFLLKNPGELGIYDNAMKFAIGVQLIIQGLTNAIQPEIFRYLKQGVKDKASDIKTLSNLFLAESIGITVMTIIPVILFITIFYETELRLSAGLVTIIFVRFILTAQYQVFAIPLMYAGKTSIFFYINSGVLILNLGLNWLLTPVIGYYGAIIAFFSAYILQVVLFSIMQQKVIHIDWNKTKIIYFPLALVFVAVLLEGVKILFDSDPFLTAVIYVLISLGGLVALYRRELMKYIIMLSK